MKLAIDACSGMGGATQALKDSGKYQVISIDINPKLNATLIEDLTKIDWDALKNKYGRPFFYWASPMCTHFSIAQASRWPRRGVQKALELVGSCFEGVAILNPAWWLIENPRGLLQAIIGKPQQTIYYSDWDADYPYQKPTNLWGNLPLPMVREIRRPKASASHGNLHLLGRSSNDRAKVPYGVSEAILRALEERSLDLAKLD